MNRLALLLQVVSKRVFLVYPSNVCFTDEQRVLALVHSRIGSVGT